MHSGQIYIWCCVVFFSWLHTNTAIQVFSPFVLVTAPTRLHLKINCWVTRHLLVPVGHKTTCTWLIPVLILEHILQAIELPTREFKNSTLLDHNIFFCKCFSDIFYCVILKLRSKNTQNLLFWSKIFFNFFPPSHLWSGVRFLLWQFCYAVKLLIKKIPKRVSLWSISNLDLSSLLFFISKLLQISLVQAKPLYSVLHDA